MNNKSMMNHPQMMPRSPLDSMDRDVMMANKGMASGYKNGGKVMKYMGGGNVKKYKYGGCVMSGRGKSRAMKNGVR
jgi:hypothetical protein